MYSDPDDILARESARARLLSGDTSDGSAEPDPELVVRPTSAHKLTPQRARTRADNLALYLDGLRIVPVRIHMPGCIVSFEAAVFIEHAQEDRMGSITLLTWSDNGVAFDPAVDSSTIWLLEVDGHKYNGMFVGGRVKLGLIAQLMSFMLAPE